MTLAEREVDLLVIGAGPAGSSAAFYAARHGLEVVLVERRRQVGFPVRCAEYVPLGLFGEVEQGLISVEQQVPRLCLHLPHGGTFHYATKGAVIHRGRFDRALAEAAQKAGAELWTGSPVESLDRRGTVTLGGQKRGTRLRGRLIIGADGPRSRVAATCGLGRPRVMMGLQRLVSLRNAVDDAHLYFWSHCRYGYGWLFPKGDVANLGVALPRGSGSIAREALAQLSHRLVATGVIDEAERARALAGDPGRSGLVPCSGPLPRLGAGRVLLAGDAAGQTDALTGAGVLAAVRGGTMAGEAVVRAFQSGRVRDAVPDYERRWRKALGRNAARALENRFNLEALWDRDVERAVARAWLPSGSKGTQESDSEL